MQFTGDGGTHTEACLNTEAASNAGATAVGCSSSCKKVRLGFGLNSNDTQCLCAERGC